MVVELGCGVCYREKATFSINRHRLPHSPRLPLYTSSEISSLNARVAHTHAGSARRTFKNAVADIL
jgi:hypothetical protein